MWEQDDHVVYHIEKLEAERDKAQARVKRLEEALRSIITPEGTWSNDRELYLKNVIDATIDKAEAALAEEGGVDDKPA